MATSKNHTDCLQAAVITMALIFTLVFLTPKSVAVDVHGSQSSSNSESLRQRKNMVLGSRPPGCVNKCMNCRPCMATLVVPPHDQKKDAISKAAAGRNHHQGFTLNPSSSRGDNDGYYLLSWKCRCGDKLFEP
ncbi:hypothetical protein Tsubulata_044555 [Turnera subulata]|uniref:Epidermal patterning factor-like protein n=1 Tax=Turnera subulata TaxID=218843 RepID=A0A9Q0J352_9ROSI|nr:hypothetical protein Tsubulata_044555 [Turnera subulata]